MDGSNNFGRIFTRRSFNSFDHLSRRREFSSSVARLRRVSFSDTGSADVQLVRGKAPKGIDRITLIKFQFSLKIKD